MPTFKITEKQNFNSSRKGYEVSASTLSSAKRIASRKQVFCDTVLIIEHEGLIVATKDENGIWENCNH